MSRYVLVLPLALFAAAVLATALGSVVRRTSEAMDEAGTVDHSDVEEYKRPLLGQHDELVVFVGRQLALAEIQPPPKIAEQIRRFDAEYRARFEVLDVIHGTYDLPEIAFEVYTHDDIPPSFSHYENVVMYVSRYGDRWIQQKYQFDPVYSTKKGGWAGCGTPHASRLEPGRYPAGALDFDPPVVFSLDSEAGSRAVELIPDDDLLRRGDSAICLRGASAETLFAIRRDGVLRSRGVFD